LSVEILGGTAKGVKLDVYDSKCLRPTSVLLKRRFFDKFQKFSGQTFFDICAGSGAIGLEAASRGAARVVLVEKDKSVFNQLKKNVEKIKIPTCKIELINSSFEDIRFPNEEISIFFDPPYTNSKLYEVFLNMVTDVRGILFIQGNDKSLLNNLSIEKLLIQGDNFIAIMRR